MGVECHPIPAFPGICPQGEQESLDPKTPWSLFRLGTTALVGVALSPDPSLPLGESDPHCAGQVPAAAL